MASRRYNSAYSISVLACAGILCAPASHADSAGDTGQLAEIVVTAQKREQSLNDVGITVDVLSADQLSERRVESAEDLARVVPGFTFANTGVNAPAYFLRGVGYNDYSLSAAPAVSVYVDDVPLAYPVMTQGAILDLKRVEVLEGPQGTLFGQNSTGGLVNYIAQKPTDTMEGGGTLSYGRFNTVEEEGYISGPIADSVRARFAFKNTTSDGWQQSLSRSDTLGAENNTAGRFLVDWDASSTVAVTFNVNFDVNRSEPQAAQATAITPLDPAGLLPVVANAPLVTNNDARAADWNPDLRPYRDDRFIQSSAKVSWSVAENLKLMSITAFSDVKNQDQIDRDGLASQNSDYNLAAYIHSLYQELRLQGTSQRVNWTVGGNFGRDVTDERNLDYIATSSNVQDLFGFTVYRADSKIHNDVRTKAAFATADWLLTDAFSVTTGVRYTDTYRNFRGCTDPTDPNSVAAFGTLSGVLRGASGLPAVPFSPLDGCIVLGPNFLAAYPQFSTNQDNVSWKLAANYKPEVGTLLYVSASRGYKSGNSISTAGSTTAQYVPVSQESLLSYETGFKKTLFERTLQLNGDVFYYTYDDLQTRSKIPDPVFGPLQALVNVPKSHAYGSELQLQWLAMKDLTIDFGAAFLQTRIDRWTGYDQLGDFVNFAGHPFSFAPKWQINADADKTWTISDRWKGLVGAGAAVRSASSADFNSSPLFKIDGYTTVSLRAGVETADGRWKIMAYGENVTDRYYWSNVVRAQDTVTRYADLPATYGISFSGKLGL